MVISCMPEGMLRFPLPPFPLCLNILAMAFLCVLLKDPCPSLWDWESWGCILVPVGVIRHVFVLKCTFLACAQLPKALGLLYQEPIILTIYHTTASMSTANFIGNALGFLLGH